MNIVIFTEDKDFPLIVEPEKEFTYPEHLKVYTYEMNSDWSMFPEPKRSQTGVFNYYPMDCSSVVAVLALCLSPGDRLLDLCSAPGGKALVALQTLLPDVVVCNDVSISRSNRTERIFRDYLIDFENNKWRERVLLSRVDGRIFTDDQGFDKVLVDVPCTTDRHSVNEDENNIFRPDRVKERLRIPELQTQLLVSVVAVLALCLSPGDRLLDLCSAPGGKALVALQTLLPDVVVCNDVSISRSNRTERIFRDYLIDFENNKWRERVLLSRVDGRIFTDDQGFDKVLVDVPCTTDRHSVNEDENNIFRPDRVKERLRIPELQTQLLV
ncbi:Putative methyltransferase NSUN4 [Papilio machaon]|uniref:NOL1/NOP2/Sun domain family member 4 n=1 Tax=Papilio machaon TaxID=76193 RepID=A0A0N1IHQ4_PAPMA|nr:Putative methyltransferase NSUN4 [Papilio machaon]